MAFNSFAIDRLAEVIPLSLSRFSIHGDVPSWNISIFYKTRALAETAVDIKLPLFCGFWLACGCVSSFSGWVVVRLEEGMWGQFTGFGFSMVDLAANSAWLVFRQGQEVLNCFKKWHAVWLLRSICHPNHCDASNWGSIFFGGYLRAAQQCSNLVWIQFGSTAISRKWSGKARN